MGKNDPYILDGREPVQVSVGEWETWHQNADRQIALTMVAPGVRVSTIFLGINYNFIGGGPPELFETAVFDDYGESPGMTCLYATWPEAELGHSQMVEAMHERLGVSLSRNECCFRA